MRHCLPLKIGTTSAILAALFVPFFLSATLADDAAPAPSSSTVASPKPMTLDSFFNDMLTQDTMTGNWGGLRDTLAKKGITFDLRLVQVYQGTVNGGLDKGWNYGGRDDTTINFDTQKMGLWPGGFLTIEGESNFGEFVGTRQTGTIFGANTNRFFPQPGTDSYDVPNLSYAQFVSHQLGFYAGKLATVTNDNGDANNFAHGKGAEGFLNLNFCFNPIIIPTVPYSALGAGAIILPTSDPKEFIINVGALDTQGSAGSSGFNTVFKGGTSYFGEARYTTHFFHLTGHQLLGGAYSDTLYTDLNQNLRNIIIPELPTQKHSGSYAVYYNFDQYVYQPDENVDRGLGLFGRVGNSDGIANPMHWTFSGGIGGKGLIPGRKLDQFGLGYYYIVAAKAKSLQTLNFGDSQGFEAYYEIALTPWLRLTPDVQVLQPSQGRVDTATVLGARLEMKF